MRTIAEFRSPWGETYVTDLIPLCVAYVPHIRYTRSMKMKMNKSEQDSVMASMVRATRELRGLKDTDEVTWQDVYEASGEVLVAHMVMDYLSEQAGRTGTLEMSR